MNLRKSNTGTRWILLFCFVLILIAKSLSKH